MDRILTQHPDGKKGVNISKEKYEIIRKAIIESLKIDELTYSSLSEAVKKKINNNFKGSIGWYVETIKRDLEAKKIIERIPKTRPQLYRLKNK